MADHNQKRLSEISFLHMLRKFDNGIRILIDAGAQILEQSNKELAENWLKIDGRAAAALYFDGDSPFILSKQNTRTPLLASPYADNLDEVLVYLDEVRLQLYQTLDTSSKCILSTGSYTGNRPQVRSKSSRCSHPWLRPDERPYCAG